MKKYKAVLRESPSTMGQGKKHYSMITLSYGSGILGGKDIIGKTTISNLISYFEYRNFWEYNEDKRAIIIKDIANKTEKALKSKSFFKSLLKKWKINAFETADGELLLSEYDYNYNMKYNKMVHQGSLTPLNINEVDFNYEKV